MKYQVLKDMQLITPKGDVSLRNGEIIKLPVHVADEQMKEGKIKPVIEVMEEKFKEHTAWLRTHNLMPDIIKKYSPELLQKIHHEINKMDNCFLNEDLQGFSNTMQKVENLYIHAVATIKEVEIWTDGACSGNPGEAGAGAVIVENRNIKKISKYLGYSTNSQAELQAAILGLENINDIENTYVILHTDSKYALNVLNGCKINTNHNLTSRLKEFADKCKDLKKYHVFGHTGNKYNEMADQLAREAITEKGEKENDNR